MSDILTRRCRTTCSQNPTCVGEIAPDIGGCRPTCMTQPFPFASSSGLCRGTRGMTNGTSENDRVLNSMVENVHEKVVNKHFGNVRLEMSACTGRSQMPAPVPVPAGTGQPERRGCKYRPGQAGPSRYTGTGSRHLPKFEVPVDL